MDKGRKVGCKQPSRRGIYTDGADEDWCEFSVNNYVMCTHRLLPEQLMDTICWYLSLFELLVAGLAEWGPESIMVLNNYMSVPSESAQRAATKRITR